MPGPSSSPPRLGAQIAAVEKEKIEAVENCVLAAFADAGLQCGEIHPPFGVENNRLAVNDRVAARELAADATIV